MTDCICHRSQTPSLLCACVFLHVHLKERERESKRERELGKQLSQAGDASLSAAALVQVSSFMEAKKRGKQSHNCNTFNIMRQRDTQSA